MREIGNVPIGVGATTADMEAMKKGVVEEPIKLSRMVGTIEHASNQEQEIWRFEKALEWLLTQMLDDDYSKNLAECIQAVLNGEHHDVPGEKAESWGKLCVNEQA